MTGAKRLRIIVGSYSRSLPHVVAKGKGISFVDVDTGTGEFSHISTHDDIANPSYIVLRDELLYVVEELAVDEASVRVFSADCDGAKLTELARVPAHGSWPCHIGFDNQGSRLFLSNYLDGSLVTWPLDGKGFPSGQPGIIRREGHGANPERQEGPHVHFALATPDGSHVLICDAGTDEIVRYRLTGKAEVDPVADLVIKTPPGSLPRHMALSADGQRLYVVSELGNTVGTWTLAGNEANLLGHVSTLPPDSKLPSASAAIRLHPNGRFLYSSNRGNNTIAVFGLNDGAALPEFLGAFSSGGETPREFAIDDTGSVMIVANQDSHNLTMLRIDIESGLLSEPVGTFSTGSPVCIQPV